MLTVIPQRCPQDHPCPCVQACPVDAVSQEGFNEPQIDKEICIECGECARICPYQAITEISIEEKIRVSS